MNNYNRLFIFNKYRILNENEDELMERLAQKNSYAVLYFYLENIIKAVKNQDFKKAETFLKKGLKYYNKLNNFNSINFFIKYLNSIINMENTDILKVINLDDVRLNFLKDIAFGFDKETFMDILIYNN